MKQRIFVCIAIFVALASILSACGQKQMPDGGVTQPAATTATAADTADAAVTTADAAAGGASDATSSAEAAGDDTLKLLEYTFSPYDAARILVTPSNDIVSPYIEERFKIKLSSVMQRPSDGNTKQTLAMWIAAGTVPDVMEVHPTDIGTVASTGKFAVLTSYAKKMPNYLKAFPEEFWVRTNYNGEQYRIENMRDFQPENRPIPIEEDPFNLGTQGHAFFIREDILSMLGYTFKPLMEIKAETADKGIKATKEMFDIDPPIDSAEKFYDFLKDVQGLGLKVNGLDLIPFDTHDWGIFHLGCILDFGHWRIDNNGDVAGYLGTPTAKEYFKFINRIYNEGLLDKDYILQSNDQLLEKIVTGRVASGFYTDFNSTIQNTLMEENPEAVLRLVPWPKTYPDLGWYDCATPEAWNGNMIRADMPPEDIERLTQFWDWLYTDEGQDIASWGPESAGLWVMDGGVKKFATAELENEFRNMPAENGYGAGKYGLTEGDLQSSYAPVIMAASNGVNYHSWNRSYPPVLDINIVCRALLSSNGVDMHGRACSSDGGSEIVGMVDDWLWSQFFAQDISKILNAKNDAEFDAAYDEVYNDFLTKANYEEARDIMEQYFVDFPPW